MVSLILLVGAFVLGLTIGDPKSRDEAVQTHVGWHIDAAMGALVFSALVHAIVLTYFMGTGRWIEETSTAYSLPATFYGESKSIKYRTIPAMVACLVLLVLTGAFGSMADPASPSSAKTLFGMPPGTVHLAAAVLTLSAQALILLWEYQALHRNGEIIQRVMAEVRRIREERGLPV
jgi:hypothetical protein